jgi:hypothetical protein
MNFLTEMFEGAWYILFPKPARKYNRDRLGKFSIKSQPIVWIDEDWKAAICKRT